MFLKTNRPGFNDSMGTCNLCPRNCYAERFRSNGGYCQSNGGYNISSVCVHRGEEPVISGENGICNIFFSRCNLRCIYCQNYQISQPGTDIQESVYTLEEVVETVLKHFENGCTHVGFVSPSHMIMQTASVIEALRQRGSNAIFVYNSNGYDKVESLRWLEGMIDVYLPDLKYMENDIARGYSGAENYPEVAAAALKEMFRQKGSTLIKDENGCAQSGLIVRHLVLPGHIENSKAVLRFIAEELSPLVHVSLMSQYYPTPPVKDHPALGKCVEAAEYTEVLEEMERLGLFRGWVQEPGSSNHYRPDFRLEHPFER